MIPRSQSPPMTELTAIPMGRNGDNTNWPSSTTAQSNKPNNLKINEEQMK